MGNKTISQVKAGVVLSYINLAVGNFIPIIYTPIMLSILGQAEYGLYSLAHSVVSYLSLLSFGIGSAVVRYLTKYRAENDKEGEERMLGLFTIVFGVIAGVTLIAGFVLSLNLDIWYSESLSATELSKMKVLLRLMTVNTALSFVFSAFSTVIVAHERFIFNKIVDVISTLATPCLNLIMLFMGFASVGLVAASTILGMAVYAVRTYYCLHYLKIRPRFDKLPLYMLKEILVFSFFIFLSNITSVLYTATDKAIIGSHLGAKDVAVYNIGATFNDIVMKISIAITGVLAPKINKMVFTNKSNGELTDLLIRIGKIQYYVIVLIVSGFIVFGRAFIKLWVGEEYTMAYWVALLVMVPTTVPLIQNVALNITIAKNKHQFRAILQLCTASLNVIGTIYFVKLYGIVGASFTTFAANCIGSITLMNWYYYKKMHLDMPRFWKNILKISYIPLFMILVGVGLSFVVDYSNPWIFIFAVILFTVAFAVLNWFIAMNDYEKNLFGGPIKAVLHKLKKAS